MEIEDRKLSKYLSFYEAVITEHRSLYKTNMEQAQKFIPVLEVLGRTIIDPIREHYNSPYIITSCFRCVELNEAVGGVADSQHCLGQACDGHILGVSLEDLFYWIWHDSDLKYGQVILEGGTEMHPAWVHVSLGEPYREISRCREAWRMINGKYTLIAKNGIMVQ